MVMLSKCCRAEVYPVQDDKYPEDETKSVWKCRNCNKIVTDIIFTVGKKRKYWKANIYKDQYRRKDIINK